MAIAVLVGTYVFSRQLPKHGIAADHALGMLILAVPLGIVGARLFHILDDFSFYWHHPGQLWTLQLIGPAIYGVLTGGVLGRGHLLPLEEAAVLRVLDALALAIPVGQLIGNCANIVNGDTWGYATRLPWGLVYMNPNALLPANLLGVPTQPTPVYEQLWLLVVIGVLLWAMPRLKTDGIAFLLYLGLYSLGRFFISFERVNNILFLRPARSPARGPGRARRRGAGGAPAAPPAGPAAGDRPLRPRRTPPRAAAVDRRHVAGERRAGRHPVDCAGRHPVDRVGRHFADMRTGKNTCQASSALAVRLRMM